MRANEVVSLNITAIMFEPVTVWPGSISIDDIGFVAGDCPVQQS